MHTLHTPLYTRTYCTRTYYTRTHYTRTHCTLHMHTLHMHTLHMHTLHMHTLHMHTLQDLNINIADTRVPFAVLTRTMTSTQMKVHTRKTRHSTQYMSIAGDTHMNPRTQINTRNETLASNYILDSL